MSSNNQIVRGGMGLADPIYRPRNGRIYVYNTKTAPLIHRFVGGRVFYVVPFFLDTAGYITAPLGVRCTPYRVLQGGKRVIFPEFPKRAWGNARISVPVNPRSGTVISTHPILVEQGRHYFYAVSEEELPLLLDVSEEDLPLLRQRQNLSFETVKIYLGKTTAETIDRRLHLEVSKRWRHDTELLRQVVHARFPFPGALPEKEDELLPRSAYVGAIRQKLGGMLRRVLPGSKEWLLRTAEETKMHAEMAQLPEPPAITLPDKKLVMSLMRTPQGGFIATAEFATDLPGEPFVVELGLDGATAHRALVGLRVELAEIRRKLEARASETFTARFKALYPDVVLH